CVAWLGRGRWRGARGTGRRRRGRKSFARRTDETPRRLDPRDRGWHRARYARTAWPASTCRDRRHGRALGPAALAPEAPAQASQPRAAQQGLHRADLGALETDEVAPARQQAQHLGARHVDDRAVTPAPQALTELERVAPITLLRWAVGLEPHLVGIDHLRRESAGRELARHEEGD